MTILMRVVTRRALYRRLNTRLLPAARASFSNAALRARELPSHSEDDPRLGGANKQDKQEIEDIAKREDKSVDQVIEDQFAFIRDNYETPKNPIILAHGLLGFDELHLAGQNLPGIQYWRGIREALEAKGIEVIVATVSPSGSVEKRALKLGRDIAEKAHGKSVNIIAHSMGGLDSRYMLSQLKPENVDVKSLTTIATPHRGSPFADFMIQQIGPIHLANLYKALEFFGLESGAFNQLTTQYMNEVFNPKTPDRDGVLYYSYGAICHPRFWSMFYQSQKIIDAYEGPNDGLVSVKSAKWGTYKGTLKDVSHLDLINWTAKIRWIFWELTGNKRTFNAIAFYLDIADMLAKEGL